MLTVLLFNRVAKLFNYRIGQHLARHARNLILGLGAVQSPVILEGFGGSNFGIPAEFAERLLKADR